MTIFSFLGALFAPQRRAVPVAAPLTPASHGLITVFQIKRVASKALPPVVNAIVDQAPAVLPHYGLVTPLRLQHFIAQILGETGYLRQIEENLD